MISGGTLVEANKTFNKLPHQLEIRVNFTTQIHPVMDDNSIPMHLFKFKEIRDISRMPQDFIVDFIGLVQNVGEIIKPSGDRTPPRTVTLEDKTGTIELTLFGKFCVDDGEKLKNSGDLAVAGFESLRVDIENQNQITSLSQNTPSLLRYAVIVATIDNIA